MFHMTNRSISFRANKGASASEIELCTTHPESHMNIYFRPGSSNGGCIQAAPEDARKLRDELLDLYPLPKQEPGIMLVRDHEQEANAFDVGFQLGRRSATPAPGKWETVADGMDRLKVDGGYIYQTEEGQIAFVPSA